MGMINRINMQEDEYYELLFEAFEEIVKKQTKQTHFFIVAKFRCSISLSKLINKLCSKKRTMTFITKFSYSAAFNPNFSAAS